MSSFSVLCMFNNISALIKLNKHDSKCQTQETVIYMAILIKISLVTLVNEKKFLSQYDINKVPHTTALSHRNSSNLYSICTLFSLNIN